MIHIRASGGAERALDHDVVVVGGGPGGAGTAAHLAGEGMRVLVVDQRSFPRDKVCGDFVGPVAVRELEVLGVTARPEYAATNIIRRAAIHVDGRQLLTQELPKVGRLDPFGRVIPRTQLDAWVLDAAVNAGAEVLPDTRVTAFEVGGGAVTVSVGTGRRQRRIRSRVLVGADGSTSTIAKRVRGGPPPRDDRIVAVRAYYDGVMGPADRADLFFSADSFPGYTWVFPTAPGTANAGVGMVLDTVPRSTEHLRDLLLRLVDTDAGVAARLGGARLRGHVVGWPLTTFNPRLPVVADGVLLVGDAAGLINPLNGEGIQYALQSGSWAASTLLEALANGNVSAAALGGYTRRVHRELRYDMALAGLVVRLIRNRDLNPVWLTALRIMTRQADRDPAYAWLAGGILAGLVPANRALSATMVGGTVSAGLSAGRIPDDLLSTGVDVARTGFTLAYDAARDPGTFAAWLRSVTAGSVELAGQVAAEAIRRPLNRKDAVRPPSRPAAGR